MAKTDKVTKKITARERAQGGDKPKNRRLHKSVGKVKKPLGFFAKIFKKIRIPLPNNRFGRIIRKIGHIIGRILLPKFVRESWAELKLVTWPGRRETISLTFAVFVFSAVFAVIVSLLDLGLDKLFREFIIKV